jgi:hypothetical protein
VARNWVEPWGDGRQEIGFIGVGLDAETISARLNSALIDTNEFTPEDWSDLRDPFPNWGGNG